MSALFLLALFTFVRTSDAMGRVLLLVLMAAFILGLAISKTRGPWLALLVGLGFVFVADRRTRGLLAIGLGACVTAVMASLPYIIQSGVLQNRVLDIETLYPRVAAYATSLNMIAHNPLFGVGFGRFMYSDSKVEYATTFGLVPSKYTLYAGVPHNEFLHMFVLTGLVGFVPFLLILYWVFRLTSRRRLREISVQPWCMDLALYLRAIAIAYIVTSLLVDTLFFRYFLMLMFFLLGVLASATGERPLGRPSTAFDPPGTLEVFSKPLGRG